MLLRHRAGVLGRLPEILLARGQAEALQNFRLSRAGAPDQDEIAVVGDENLAVGVPVTGDLRAAGRCQGVVGGRLDFDGSPRRRCAEKRLLAALKLVFGEEAAVGNAGALVGDVHDAAHTGLEFLADGAQEIGQGRIIGSLGDGRAGRAEVAQIAKVGLQWMVHKLDESSPLAPFFRRFGPVTFISRQGEVVQHY